MEQVIEHKLLGRVAVTFKANARRFIARRYHDCIALTAPARAGIAEINRALDSMAPGLMAIAPPQQARFYEGQQLSFDGLDITITSQSVHPDRIILSQNATDSSAVIALGSNIGFDDDKAVLGISNAMKAVARRAAPRILVPRARQLAARFGCHPSGWKISSGARILGQCDANGIVSLSYMNVFLPAELRDYIICHELAHLSELNHSERFHRVCDAYLGGREQEVIAKLVSVRGAWSREG
ncbi:MAG: M48 family metallopeptidase, partial [Muribaculaceae bacterium]|nr:M48 family metallopeptidase [Muribaculaceae bacterium]